MSDPPALPENFYNLNVEDSRPIWESLAPYLESHGYHLAKLDGMPECTLKDPPVNSFRPTSTEAFVHHPSPNSKCPDPASRPYRSQRLRPNRYIASDRHGRVVFLKAVQSSSNECIVAKALESSEMRNSPDNHAIPVIDFLVVGDWTIMVMPFWLQTFTPEPYRNHADRLAMAQQLSEGLCFFHSKGIVHGDLHHENIVLNHSGSNDQDAAKLGVNFYTFPAQYAFIDFGSAHTFTGDSRMGRSPSFVHVYAPLELAIYRDPYDMFAADVFSLGEVLFQEVEMCRKIILHARRAFG